MKNNFDNFTNTITQPDVFLCHRNYDVICPLTPITDLKIYEAANSYDEITFSFNRVNNSVEFECWDKLKSLKVVKVKNANEEKYFEIAVDVSDEESTVKNITGISMEGELAQISIGTLSVNGKTDRDNDSNWENNTYISTVVYKASDTKHSLLHRILSYAPHWKIGHIDSHITDSNTNQLVETSTVVRTFEFSNTNVYDALQEVAKELDVVFTFDSKTRSVNMYDLNTAGEDTTVFVNKENLANSFTCSSNKDSIKNCFKVTGGDDLINSYVRSVNPNGSEYIYYISKDQREDMSDELVAKLDAYDNLYESKKTGYENACAEMFAAIDDVQKYTNTLAPQRTDVATTAIDEYNKLKNIASVYVQSKKNLLQKGVEKAILTLAQITVDYRYTVTIQDEDTYDEVNSVWTGKFKVVNESNSEDVVVGTDDVTISILEDEKTSLQNQIDKLIGDGNFKDATVDELKEKYIDKDPKDYDYCQERLQEMWKVYAECANVLLEKGYAVKKDDNKFYSLYSEYHQKEQILSTAYLNMTNYIESLEKIKEEKAKQVNAYHDELDFVKFLGDKLYKEFCCYRREDVYENSNYISDGLSDKEAIEKAKTLIEVATKELYKASLFQYTYTANLNNLFNNSIFKPFWEHFALFNWIRAEVDERVISLRLIGITYDYANPDKIEVEFSEQVRNANGITDLESILNQAKSMATSYSSTAKQASQGAESYSDFKTLKEEGLNSALMNIKNSNNEEVTVDGRGINCRSRDVNDDYDQCQLRITGKNIVMTDDDWNSARLAIGKMNVNEQDCYGIVADLICGDLIAGETLMISNGSKTFIVDKDGIIVNNMKLDMYSADKKHRLLIDPNLKSMFNIYNEDKQVFFIDANGNVTMKGNLYINNGNTYLKADMDDENIIEVGCGEIEDTGNDGEIDKPNTEYVTQEWYRSSDALNMLNYAWDSGGNYEGSSDYDSDNYYKNMYFGNNNVTIKNGVVYMIHDNTIRSFDKDKNTWNFIDEVDAGGSFTPIFVENDRDDNCLYIFKHNNDAYCYSLYAYNLENNKLYEVWRNGNNASATRSTISSAIIINNTFYTFSNSKTTDAAPIKVAIPYSQDGIYTDVSTEAVKSNYINANYTLSNFVLYNNETYCIRLDVASYTADLCKVIDIETQKVKILASDICSIRNPYTNDNYRYLNNFSCFVHKGSLFIIPFVKNKNKNYYIYNFSENKIITKTNLPPLECGDYHHSSSYRVSFNGCLAFSDGENIHLYNDTDVYSYRSANVDDDRYCLFHYVYNENNKASMVKNFKEETSGKNFINTLQCGYIIIGDKIYSCNSTNCFDNYRNDAKTDRILCLDTSKENAEWEELYEATDCKINYLIQSNAKDKIYFGHSSCIYDYKKTVLLAYYDIKLAKVMYLKADGTYTDNYNQAYDDTDINWHGTFGYIDDDKQIIYQISKSSYFRAYKIVDGCVSSDKFVYKKQLNYNVVSNIVFKNNAFYYLAEVNSEQYTLYKLDLNGTEQKLIEVIVGNDYNKEFGFSIFLYNDKIQVFHSYRGVLSKDRYVYNLVTSKLDKYSDVFQDLGLYIIDTSYNISSGISSGKRTIFLPMIPTENNGVHIFVGYPFFLDDEYNNGGYKHYVYTEGTTEPDNPDLPNIPNPTDKIFYITNKGDAYLYGNVYAKDGIFRGDIYARSLTLGSDVSIDTSKITGLDNKLKDIKNDFNGVTDDLKNVVYKGDIVTTTEKLDNGVIKTTSRVPTGVDADGNVTYEDSVTYTSADGNYVMTDVGLGDKEKENGCYTIISKEGLLEAVNAKVSGTVYANAGKFGGWDIGKNGLKSELFDDASSMNGIRLDSNGEIRSKGSMYSSLDGDGSEGWFARLCSGKWIFGYYDNTQSDPFIPPKGTPYSDISVNGIYMCSREAIQNKDTRYLFEANTLNDTVNITNSSKTSPALTITNNYYDNVGGYDAPALVLHSPKQGYRNRPLDVRLKVTGKLLGTDQTVDAQYSVALFGEEQLGRIIFRSNTFDTTSSPVGNTVSDTSSNPTVPSILGSDTFRWYQGYFMELYSKNGVNTSSDKKIKNHIGYMNTDKSLEFVNDLKPVEYTLKDNANGRKHMGFYAQDVKETADNLELGNMSLYSAVWNKDGNEKYYSAEAPDKELNWSLKYEEFIAPLAGAVQELTKRDKENKERISKLEDTVQDLIGELKSLKEQLNK